MCSLMCLLDQLHNTQSLKVKECCGDVHVHVGGLTIAVPKLLMLITTKCTVTETLVVADITTGR